jgi:mRNA-degrading endonuclease RelE of RelBE toxin-antitoxin system
MSFKIKTIPNFDKELKSLSKKYRSLKAEITALGDSLAEDPMQGESLGKNCYKIRLSIKSKNRGKSGGARVISCVVVVSEVVMLLSIYDKSEQADISDAFLVALLQDNGLL